MLAIIFQCQCLALYSKPCRALRHLAILSMDLCWLCFSKSIHLYSIWLYRLSCYLRARHITQRHLPDCATSHVTFKRLRFNRFSSSCFAKSLVKSGFPWWRQPIVNSTGPSGIIVDGGPAHKYRIFQVKQPISERCHFQISDKGLRQL